MPERNPSRPTDETIDLTRTEKPAGREVRGSGVHYAGRYIYGYVVLCFLIFAGVLLLQLQVLLGRMVPDDGFYYLQIARNLARLGRQTFDGIHWTNGYHPLWGWILAGFAFPFRQLDSVVLFRAALLLNAVVYCSGLWIFARAWNKLIPRAWLLLLTMSAVVIVTSYTWLMETALVVLLLGLLVAWVSKLVDSCRRAQERGYWIRLGFILSLLGLARLDAVFVGAFMFITAVGLTWQKDSGGGNWKPIWTIVTSVVLLGSWLLFTRVSSGHWGTISGALKMHAAVTPPEHSLVRTWKLVDPLTKFSAAVCLIYLGAYAARYVRPRFVSRAGAQAGNDNILPYEARVGKAASRENRAEAMVLAFSAAAVAHLVFQFLLVPWQGFAWTYIFQRLALLVIVALLLERALSSGSRIRRALAHGTVVLVSGLLLGTWLFRAARELREPQAWTYHAYLAAEWARRYLPGGSVLATKDAGVLGYFSERPVVNLDGLVNNWEYQEALRLDKHVDHLRDAGVTHLVQHNVEEHALNRPYRFWFYSALYSREATPLFLHPNRMVYKGIPFRHGNGRVHVLIWKFP